VTPPARGHASERVLCRVSRRETRELAAEQEGPLTGSATRSQQARWRAGPGPSGTAAQIAPIPQQIGARYNFDGIADFVQVYGNGNSEDQYLVGDWNGDGLDNIAVRRGNNIPMDFNFDGIVDFVQVYGNGNSEDQYLVGDWNSDGCGSFMSTSDGSSFDHLTSFIFGRRDGSGLGTTRSA
jgi:hypothetical protein